MEEEIASSVTCPTDGPNDLLEIGQNPGFENSPSSAAEQEVNKPLVDNIDIAPSEVHQPDDTIIKDECNDPNAMQIPNGESNAGVAKKVKRNVCFPDQSLVQGYLEPPNPWKDVPQWRTEDLLKAYKQSCEKHGTKPLNKLLMQLQCIENVGERYEILSLKGERLDMKQCESLEEIFRHVRFRCVDFEATHLDDEMAVALFEMVEYYESACKLNISFNKGIGPRGWQSCSRLVRKTPCLTNIDARNCDMNERVIPIMGRALRMGCYLTTLQLQNANLQGRALVILVAAIKMNELLKELFIGDNKFLPTDGIQIGNLLKYNHKLELLDLRNNHLQDVGLGHVCVGLAEQTLDTGLLTLVLWNNQITFQGMAAINNALTHSENLETLNLGRNPITNEGIHILKEGLLKTKSLLKLGLSGTKVSCEGAVALAEAIADSPRLVRLDLQENDIKTAGLMALSLALKLNESLTRLDIDRDFKKESGVKDYAEQQKRLQQDIAANLDRNRDIAHKREEERRQIELQNQENARKLEEAAKDLELSPEDTHAYIPSQDTIHRPKLLFVPYTCPEQELDSPILGEEFLQAKASSPSVAHLQLSTAGSDLLSPQYCENPKIIAKKIFSVTRVLSPGNDVLSPSNGSYVGVGSPTQIAPRRGSLRDSTNSLTVPQLCMPLPTVDLPTHTGASVSVPVSFLATAQEINTPASMQKAIEDETLVTYIQQIVGGNNDCGHFTNSRVTLQSDNLTNIPETTKSVGILIDANASNNLTCETKETDVVSAEVSNGGEDDKNASSENTSEDAVIGKASCNTGSDIEKEHGRGDNGVIHIENERTSTTEAKLTEEKSEHEGDIKNGNLLGESEMKNLVPSEKASGDGILKETSNSTVANLTNSSNPAEEMITETGVTAKLEDCDNVVSVCIPNIPEASGETTEHPVDEIAENNNADNLLDNSVVTDETAQDTYAFTDPKDEESCTEEFDDKNGNKNIQKVFSESEDDNTTSSQIENLTKLDCFSQETCEEPYTSLSDMDIPSLTDNDILSECDRNTNEKSENTKSNAGLNGDYVECEGNIEEYEENLTMEQQLSTTTSTNSSKGDNMILKSSGVGSNCDLEQWNTVTKRDIAETEIKSDDNGNTSKPDFFTNLSLNGLKQELASMIDDEGNHCTSVPMDAPGNILGGNPAESIVPNGENRYTLDSEFEELCVEDDQDFYLCNLETDIGNRNTCAETPTDWFDTASMETEAS